MPSSDESGVGEIMTTVIPFESRQSAGVLLEHIEALIPKAERCRDNVAELNQLIGRRDALACKRDLGSKYVQLCDEVESRFQEFKGVDEEIRAVVSALQDLFVQLPPAGDDLDRLRQKIEQLPLLSGAGRSLQVDKAVAVHDLGVIRLRLSDLMARPNRPSPAEVIDQGRKKLGLSIEALAQKAGVNPNQIYSIKKGGNPTAGTLRCVAAALGNPHQRQGRRPLLGRQPFARVCLRRAKADSPLPHDGPRDPVPTLGTGRVAPAISCEWRNR
jgi:hypothetical protein